MLNQHNNEMSCEFNSMREVYNQVNNLPNSWWFKFALVNKCLHWQHWHWTILQVHAMSWMPDLIVFSPLFSWLKHSENSSSKDFSMTFWIQRLEMHSVCYLSLRDALLSSALSNSLLFLYETIWHKNSLYCQVLSSSMKIFFCHYFFLETVRILERQHTIWR